MKTAETNTIEVVVNGDAKQVPEGLDVVRLLAHLDIEASRVAVELNREIVHKAEWSATPILHGAKLEIVWFVGGG